MSALPERTPTRAAAGERTLLRLELPDRPGSLSVVAGVLGGCGVNILSIEVLEHHEGSAVDDFLVAGGDLQRALTELGPYVRVLACDEHADLPDPGLAIADAFARVVAAARGGELHLELAHAVLGLMQSDAGVVFRPDGDRLVPIAATVGLVTPVALVAADAPLAEVSMSAGSVGLELGEAWAPHGVAERLGPGSAALASAGDPVALVVACVRSSGVPFTQIELARLGAFLAASCSLFATVGS